MNRGPKKVFCVARMLVKAKMYLISDSSKHHIALYKFFISSIHVVYRGELFNNLDK